MYRRSLVWFTQNLRLQDNLVLYDAHLRSDRVLHVFFAGDFLKPSFMPGLSLPSYTRQLFLYQALTELKDQLAEQGQVFLILAGRAEDLLPQLIRQYRIDAIFKADEAGADENQYRHFLVNAYPDLSLVEEACSSLYLHQDLPDDGKECYPQFTPFRKRIEQANPRIRPLAGAVSWSKPLLPDAGIQQWYMPLGPQREGSVRGGEHAAQQRLKAYFSQNHVLAYKETRNALEGVNNSTKFSPWLATGCLSPVQVLSFLHEFENLHGANESTQWLFIELLWREYFFWRAKHLGPRLFMKSGYRKKIILNTFYPERFKAWCEGATPWPLVNACMRELKQTGFMSNRGRQIVASCFVNELQLDWRYGAAYFEQQLIDYDVASNWGNWQYLAGVGSDPRGLRHFDIQKQTTEYDPQGWYTKRWGGELSVMPIDSRDAADWPLL